MHELGHGVRVVGRAQLPVRRRFRKPRQPVGEVEIAARLGQHPLDDRWKVHRRDQRYAVGKGFLEAEIFRVLGVRRRNAEHAVDHRVADLVGDDVEVEREGQRPPGGVFLAADLEEAVAILRVVPLRQQRDLKPVIAVAKMPFERLTEIALPDVEREAHAAEGVRCHEAGLARKVMVEMAAVIGNGRRRRRPGPCRQIEVTRAERAAVQPVGARLAERLDDIHARVGGTRSDAAGRRRDGDDFGAGPCVLEGRLNE